MTRVKADLRGSLSRALLELVEVLSAREEGFAWDSRAWDGTHQHEVRQQTAAAAAGNGCLCARCDNYVAENAAGAGAGAAGAAVDEPWCVTALITFVRVLRRTSSGSASCFFKASYSMSRDAHQAKCNATQLKKSTTRGIGGVEMVMVMVMVMMMVMVMVMVMTMTMTIMKRRQL